MSKVKEILRLFKEAFEKFPLTTIAIYLATIILAVVIDTDIIDSDTLANILLFSGIFACGSFCIETSFKSRKKSIPLYILSVVLALASTILVNNDNNVIVNTAVKYIVCYVVSILLFSLYANFRKSDLAFNNYLASVATNIFKTSIIYCLVSIGMAMITSAFIALILNDYDYTIMGRIEILLFGLYYIPNIMYALNTKEKKEDKFVKVIFKYVLDVMLMIAFLVIYIYIAKIIVLRDMPSNQVYRIITTLFVLGLPIWTIASSYKEEKGKILTKINNILPMLFIPFILLQIYSIGVRIINNGMTELRYVCTMIVIFEIIYVAMYIKNREKIGNILLVLIGTVIISSIVPYINMFKVSELSQLHNLKIYTNKSEYSDEDKTKIKGAYYYLRRLDNGDEIINKVLTKDDIEKIINFNSDYSYGKNRYESIYAFVRIDNINIKDYNKLYMFDASKYYYDSPENMDMLFKNVEVNDEITIDLTNLVQEYIEKGDSLQEYLEEYNEYTLEDNSKVIITTFSIDYDDLDNVYYYSIDGYLLEK